MNKCAEYGVDSGLAMELMNKIAAKPIYDKLSARELNRLWGNNGWIDGAIHDGRLPLSERGRPPAIGQAGNSTIDIFHSLNEAMARKYPTYKRLLRAEDSRDAAIAARSGSKGYLRSAKNLAKRMLSRRLGIPLKHVRL